VATLATGCGASSARPREPPARPRLLPARPFVVRACKRMQEPAPFTVYCPRKLPRATRGWPPGPGQSPPAKLRVEIYGNPYQPRRPQPYGLDVGYGVPVEPAPGDWWRKHLQFNRPDFFLHFTVFRVTGVKLPPRPQLRPMTVGGRRGWLKPAKGYGLSGTTDLWWANHSWFFWRSQGVLYAASLHYFGPGTLRLLDRLVAALRPT
jgi:hypothetical protein